MLCEACNQNQATTHIKSVINGQLTEQNLCAACAAARGFGAAFAPFGADIGNLIGGMFSHTPDVRREDTVCPACGTTYHDIAKSGKIGCAGCYEIFRDRLEPMIQRIHGTTLHKGKRPGGAALRVQSGTRELQPPETKLQKKKRLMQKAILEQDFEAAAVLRDEIKELEQHEQ